MKIRRDESGQMLVLTALCMMVLLGFMALALDVGLLFRSKRNVQIQADAAAIAGALEANYNGNTNWTTVAKAAATNNFMPASATFATANPVTSGWHTGSAYYEVVVTEPNQTFFLSIFGLNPANVSARAVAGVTWSPTCMYVLNPNGQDTFHVQGNATITAPNCGITVDSNSAKAFCDTGNSVTVNAPYIRIVGGQDPQGNCKQLPSGTTVQTGTQPVTDPFNSMPGPQPTATTINGVAYPASCNTGSGGNTTSATTITDPSQLPATSNGVICFTSNVTLSNVTLSPASPTVYLFQNGVNLSGTVTVSNATLDVYQGTFSQGNAVLNLSGPADKSAPYNAIGLMQPASNTTGACSPSAGLAAPCLQVQFGSSTTSCSSSSGSLDAMIYAPTSSVYLQDQGGCVQATTVIAWNFYTRGNLTLTNNYSAVNPTSPLQNVELVE